MTEASASVGLLQAAALEKERKRTYPHTYIKAKIFCTSSLSYKISEELILFDDLSINE